MKKKIKNQSEKKQKILKQVAKLKNKILAKEKKISKLEVKITKLEKKVAEKNAKKQAEITGVQSTTTSLNN